MSWVGKMSVARFIFALVLMAIWISPTSRSAWASTPADSDIECPIFHIVERRETLGMIANLYGATVERIREANDLVESDKVKPGDLLCIPDPSFEWLYPNSEMFAHVSMTARTVQIVGSGFPIQYRFYVKVRANRAGGWKKLGALRSSRLGSFDRIYSLPKKLKPTQRLDVCLKEMVRGYLLCYRISNVNPDS